MFIKSVFVSEEKSGELDSAPLLNIIYTQYRKRLALSGEKNGVIIVEMLNIPENLYQMSTILVIHF